MCSARKTLGVVLVMIVNLSLMIRATDAGARARTVTCGTATIGHNYKRRVNTRPGLSCSWNINLLTSLYRTWPHVLSST